MQVSYDPSLSLGPRARHIAGPAPELRVEDVSVWYDAKRALNHVSLDIYGHEVTAFIGPSGCGKTTLLRCLNRTLEIVENVRMEGRVLLGGDDIYAPDLDPPLVRSRFGWIAQQPNPFPWSIRTNIVYGPRIQGVTMGRADEDAVAERAQRAVGLWDEVKDRLKEPGPALSIGQQQRLCIARAIATNPEVLLMDEPCSALDPVATALIENLIDALRASYTIVIITHNLQQAARISQRIAFFHLGELVEAGDTENVITRPQTARCRAFVTGRYG